jgi:hypothetical protein
VAGPHDKTRGGSDIRHPADVTGNTPVSTDWLKPKAICAPFPHCIRTIIELLHDGNHGWSIVGQPVPSNRKLFYPRPSKAVVSGANRENLRTTMQITIDTCLNRTLFQLPCTKFRNTIMQRISL